MKSRFIIIGSTVAIAIIAFVLFYTRGKSLRTDWIKDLDYEGNQVRDMSVGFTDKFEYPLRLAINSDLLKSNHFVITIDKIQNTLIISQN